VNEGGTLMKKGKLISTIFRIAVLFLLVGPMLGKTASTIIRKSWREQLESFGLAEIH
jgi:hypothetical protein